MSNTAYNQMMAFRNECVKENRYGELDKIIQVYVDRLINSLASSGSCITEEKKIELLKSFQKTVSEETQKGMTLDESEDEEDSEIETEEFEWEECYAFYNCDEIEEFLGAHDHLQHFKHRIENSTEFRTTYYQTYGGGPEGGYFVKVTLPLTEDGKAIGGGMREVFAVDRNWGTPFSATLIPGKKLKYEPGVEPSPRHAGKVAQVQLVDE
jgi:hypothetical protein